MMLQSEIVASQKQELHALFSDAQNYTSTLLIPPLLGWDEGKIEDRMRAVYTYGMASHL
jgi:adenylyl- and sulfurtransferase ThiI